MADISQTYGLEFLLDDFLGFFRYQKHFMSQFYSLSVSFSEIYKWLIHLLFRYLCFLDLFNEYNSPHSVILKLFSLRLKVFEL